MTDVEAFDFTPSWDFYDLMKDPGEKHNAYNDKEYAPIVRNLKKQMLKLRLEVGDTDDNYPEMQWIISENFH